jgi:hypothetical protein
MGDSEGGGGYHVINYSFRVQRYICCMIYVRYEYSFSQAALDERRNDCASYIMYGYRA